MVFSIYSKIVHQAKSFVVGELRRLGVTTAANGAKKESIYG